MIQLWWLGNVPRAKNAAVELGGSFGFETQTMPNAFRNVKKTHGLPYIIASPVSCRKRTLLCLKSHIVRIVSVKSKMNVSKFTLSCLWLSSASFSVESSSMPPSSALIRQHWLKINVKIGNIELCPPNAYNVHGFGAVVASMVQDAGGGLPHSLLQLRQVTLESEAERYQSSRPWLALLKRHAHQYSTLTLFLIHSMDIIQNRALPLEIN